MTNVVASSSTDAVPTAKVPSRWPVSVWVVLVGSFIVRACGFACPFLPYHVSGLGFSTSATGLVVACFGVGYLVGQVGCGWLADRAGRRVTLAGAMIIAALIMPTLAEVRSVTAVMVASLITGMVYDAARPVAAATIADAVPAPEEQAVVNGWRHYGINIAAALTGSLGGYLASVHGTSMLFWANAGACALLGIAALRLLPDGTTSLSAGTSGRIYRTALRDRNLWLLSLSSLCALTCAGGMFTALPILMTNDHLDAAAYGWTQVANAAAVLALSPFLTPWVGRRAAARSTADLLAVSSLSLGAAMAVAGLSDSVLGYAVAAAAAVPGEVVVFIAAGALVNRIAPPEAQGVYAGLWGVNLALAIIAAPLLAVWALDNGGGLTASLLSCAVGGGGAVFGMLLHWHLNRPQTNLLQPQRSRTATPPPAGMYVRKSPAAQAPSQQR